MSISLQDVAKIANLARLEITEEEAARYANSLTSIMELIEQMSEVDTTDVAPLSHPLDATQRLRDDEVTASNQRDLYQNIAPQVEAGLYLVPQIIE